MLDGGVAITASFDSAWPLAKGMYYDVESRSKSGDGAFMQVAGLPEGKTLESLPKSFFTNNILSAAGRYGAFGAPTDVKVLSSSTEGAKRVFDITFNALSPGQQEAPRRALVAAIQPEGSASVVMLVGGATSGRWKATEPAVRKAISSFKVWITCRKHSNQKAHTIARWQGDARGAVAGRETGVGSVAATLATPDHPWRHLSKLTSSSPTALELLPPPQVSQSRSTKLKRTRASDYRYEEQGGLWAGVKDEPSAF